MEQVRTPENIENCPSTPEEPNAAEGTSNLEIEEARLLQLKMKIEKGILCVICYSNVHKNESFPENCLHIFHFECLQRWSEQKNQCPLCKKVFDQIIHNIKSKTEYDRHPVNVIRRPEESNSPVDLRTLDLVSLPMLPLNVPLNSVFHSVDFLTNHSPRRRFTYRTRFEATMEQNERIQELFGGGHAENDYSRLTVHGWRRSIYDRNLYALPLADVTGRYRECSAEFYRNNPAQTHRLIPWLNRELLVLISPSQVSAIPRILDDLREILCRHDIQSRKVRKYFQRYLNSQTDHFIHEFYNFAISPFDIVGYDRHVDYNARTQSTTTTVEISSNDSSDGEVQVIDDVEPDDLSTLSIPIPSTTIVLETSGAQEENCLIADVTPQIIEGDSHIQPSSEVVVESSLSSDSECQFVLALKPPHLRTPEMLSLTSASDSDVVFIPNEPPVIARVDSSTTDSEDNKPLAETRKQLKAEFDDFKPDISVKEDALDVKDVSIDHMESSNNDIVNNIETNENNSTIEPLNYGASTSKLVQSTEQNAKPKKFYFVPKRRKVASRSIFESSSSKSSSSSTSSSCSEESNENSKIVNLKKKRKMSASKLKKIRMSSVIVNPKPLSQLPTSEEAHNNDVGEGLEQPRIKSVIIKKNDNLHYIKQTSDSSSDSTEGTE